MRVPSRDIKLLGRTAASAVSSTRSDATNASTCAWLHGRQTSVMTAQFVTTPAPQLDLKTLPDRSRLHPKISSPRPRRLCACSIYLSLEIERSECIFRSSSATPSLSVLREVLVVELLPSPKWAFYSGTQLTQGPSSLLAYSRKQSPNISCRYKYSVTS
jgi:hypothetical protein